MTDFRIDQLPSRIGIPGFKAERYLHLVGAHVAAARRWSCGVSCTPSAGSNW